MGLRRYLDDKAYELVLFLEKCLHLLGKFLYERGALSILLMIFPLLLWYILNLGTLGFFGWVCNNIYVKYELWFERKTCSKLKKEYPKIKIIKTSGYEESLKKVVQWIKYKMELR